MTYKVSSETLSLIAFTVLTIGQADDSQLALLSGMFTIPRLQLQPSFNSSVVTDYYTTVSHSVIVIRVVVVTAHCRTEARLNSVNGPTRSVVYMLFV